MGNVANVKIEACKATWGKNTKQVQTVIIPSDVSSSLKNKYFYLYYSGGTKFHVWFDDGTGADPAPGGSTACHITYTANATGATLAGLLATAIAALNTSGDFTCTASGNVITVSDKANGYAHPIHDSPTATAVGISPSITTQGMTAADVGLVMGDMTLKTAEELEDIKAQETGGNVLGQLRKGFNADLQVTFLETSVAQLTKVLVQSGLSMLPEGAGTTAVVGLGAGKLFQNTFAQANQLVLHPASLPASDHSRDWTFWLAYPKLDSLKFSGEKQQDIPLTFKLFMDQTQKKGYEYAVYGDATQTIA